MPKEKQTSEKAEAEQRFQEDQWEQQDAAEKTQQTIAPPTKDELISVLKDTLWGIRKLCDICGVDIERDHPVYFDHLPRARDIIHRADKTNTLPDFDPFDSWESPTQAIEACKKQPDPTQAMWAVVHANCDMGEVGFSTEVLYDWFNSEPDPDNTSCPKT